MILFTRTSPLPKNKKVSDCFTKVVYACICMRTCLTIALFTGLIPVQGSCLSEQLKRHVQLS